MLSRLLVSYILALSRSQKLVKLVTIGQPSIQFGLPTSPIEWPKRAQLAAL